MFDKPEQVLQCWLDAINSGKLERAISLYSDDAVLLPTFSNKTLTDSKDKELYFSRLASYKNLSVELHERTLRTQQLSASLYLISGIYCWRLEIEEELLSFEARFTMAMELSSPSPILHQHSSQVPRML